MILARMSFFKSIIESGVSCTSSKSEKRNVLLSNYIAVIVALAPIGLMVARYLVGDSFRSNNLIIIPACSVLFLLPVFCNRLGFIYVSRFLLSWIPSYCILGVVLLNLKQGGLIETSDLVGIRFYFLAFGCIPFLVFNVRKPVRLLLALTGSLFPLIFFDPILNFFQIGYQQLGLTDTGYEFNLIRILISLLIIGLGFYFLKFLIEKNDALNELLVKELEDKNHLIQQQADNEVHQLNDQLKANLQHLSEREFILNQSQRIAKIGSWEYRIENSFLFWSDEMYNIFGLDKSFPVASQNLSEALGEEGSNSINVATTNLLKTGQPYDLTIRTRTPLGYRKWFRVYAFPIIEREQVVGVRGICHDITFFKEAEEKLRASEAKFSTAFENNPDFIMLVRETDLLVVDVNQRIRAVLGFEKAEVIGQSARKMDLFLDEDERQQFIRSYDEKGYTEYECTWKRKDGRVIQVRVTALRMSIEGVNYRMSVVQDITERKAAEEKFLKAFDLSPDLMVIFRERDLVVVESNRKLEEVSGFTREEAIGSSAAQKGFVLWVSPEEREAFYQNYNVSGYTFQESELRRKDGSTFFATVSAQRILLSDENHMIVVVRDISERKRAEQEKERARYLLNERIKELTTLYRISQILHDDQKPVDEVLQLVVSILPMGWKFSEVAAARIKIDEMEFMTPNFASGFQLIQADFVTQHGQRGIIEVTYLDDRPLEVEGPFLQEERNLINLVADMIRVYLDHKHEKEALSKSEANLSATINNTEVLIWSVDRSFKLLMFNQPFFDYIKIHYGVEIRLGSKIIENPSGPEGEVQAWWEQNYMKSLAGEITTLDETRFGMDFQYSLSPIIENSKIIGVSVFADNVTERKARDRELAEANKKIGELRLMALRSVMNPHFIFNVLNSIQFFIAKNDRLNAINYLSMFSKLIRSILTHSVDNKIKLSDELELLRNYTQLEMTRFENKFDFRLNVDDQVDVDSIEIPSLLIQPYVENAILHGLYNKQERGMLTINVHEKDEAIIFEIEDNGIGREAARKLRQQNFPTHKSMGIKLTEERLKLINEHRNVAVQIQDITNGTEPCGTRITIWITY
ncbi:MAG: PAS domain S-box protein [Cyclobacteriaceae bacterium]|nr:PAS domain S-box protein [Cyclobacteriaceae bacterium]